ncbi:hypothetical protein [Roseovarius salinarum]|uniref:hypothetical protein n=1 Tax=Roseovarius salinarum TaxID=1981892 RepID=UPI000C32E940|nr:hypothetical protein [Roseovarius salinarum]
MAMSRERTATRMPGRRERPFCTPGVISVALLDLRVPVGLAMPGVGIAGNFALLIVAPFGRRPPGA